MICEYNCEACGKTCRKTRSPANTPKPPRFCSQKCNGASRVGTGSGVAPNCTVLCETCGETRAVYRSPSAPPPRFCSLPCLGKAQRGEGNPAFTGGRHVLNTGYVVVLAPDHPAADSRGYILEHRLVAEKSIGRPLLPGEVVHHLDHNPLNNDPANLEVLPSQSEHMKRHRAEEERAA
jgi:hypothetical protein